MNVVPRSVDLATATSVFGHLQPVDEEADVDGAGERIDRDDAVDLLRVLDAAHGVGHHVRSRERHTTIAGNLDVDAVLVGRRRVARWVAREMGDHDVDMVAVGRRGDLGLPVVAPAEPESRRREG